MDKEKPWKRMRDGGGFVSWVISSVAQTKDRDIIHSSISEEVVRRKMRPWGEDNGNKRLAEAGEEYAKLPKREKKNLVLILESDLEKMNEYLSTDQKEARGYERRCLLRKTGVRNLPSPARLVEIITDVYGGSWRGRKIKTFDDVVATMTAVVGVNSERERNWVRGRWMMSNGAKTEEMGVLVYDAYVWMVQEIIRRGNKVEEKERTRLKDIGRKIFSALVEQASDREGKKYFGNISSWEIKSYPHTYWQVYLREMNKLGREPDIEEVGRALLAYFGKEVKVGISNTDDWIAKRGEWLISIVEYLKKSGDMRMLPYSSTKEFLADGEYWNMLTNGFDHGLAAVFLKFSLLRMRAAKGDTEGAQRMFDDLVNDFAVIENYYPDGSSKLLLRGFYRKNLDSSLVRMFEKLREIYSSPIPPVLVVRKGIGPSLEE